MTGLKAISVYLDPFKVVCCKIFTYLYFITVQTFLESIRLKHKSLTMFYNYYHTANEELLA